MTPRPALIAFALLGALGARAHAQGAPDDNATGTLYALDGSLLVALPADDNGTLTPEPVLELSGASPHALAVDGGSGFVYWISDPFEGGEILRAPLDATSPASVLVSGLSGALDGLRLDPVGGWIFWVDNRTPSPAPTEGRLWRARLDGGARVRLLERSTRLYPPGLDPIAQRLYLATGEGELVRLEYSGSGLTTIASFDLAQPTAVAVDPLGGSLFYHLIGTGEDAIYRADLDGSRARLLAPTTMTPDLALDPIAGRLYFTYSRTHYRRVPLAGGPTSEVLVAQGDPPTRYRGLALVTGYCGGCDDGDPCTAGFCGLDERCAFLPRSCDDGLSCTGDRCAPGIGCVSTPEDAACDDGLSCTVDRCDPVEGCVATPHDEACDDGDPCTLGRCDPLDGCVFDAELPCDDGDPCTLDACTSGVGCVHSPASGPSCDDGDGCTIGDRCEGGLCVSGPEQPCDDQNACTLDRCGVPAVSARRCDALGWGGDFGLTSICGATKVDGACSGPLTWDEARRFCEDAGGRLCTLPELARGETRGTGCGYDDERVWSATTCDLGRAWTQAGSDAFLGAHPRECSEMSEALAQARCCADVELGVGGRRCLFEYDVAACDDGDPCTLDTCAERSRCHHEPVEGCVTGGGADAEGGERAEPDRSPEDPGGGCQGGPLSGRGLIALLGASLLTLRRRREVARRTNAPR